MTVAQVRRGHHYKAAEWCYKGSVVVSIFGWIPGG